MTLYLVTDEESGDCLDLFVRANSVTEALSAWRTYYHMSPTDSWVRVFEVPPVNGPPGSIHWDTLPNLNGTQ